ncbi:hypothetical protein CCM_03448 [Cordyceps militaris CM01]|uniref:F-box domain-containing protein n=1 Tax=Cordyceps militaris (strain CM01) TaxID=983644 RepID=G3JAR1_CORMM|nr:uncharacterized protein CCM_03448 [Cordyceps militaris CM01]EGX95176.1 hypothetical protein CCM_03448 [Cordyceps militaris CM01]
MKFSRHSSDLASLMRNHKKLKPNHFINNIPVDVLEVMADHLPLESLLALTQTCKGLHAALHHRLQSTAQKTSREELLECLFKVVRRRPDAWVCQECVKLHRANNNDTPHHAAPSCPHTRYIPLHCGPRSDTYELHHHHVQLSIRLNRLRQPTPMQREYLARLLQQHTSTGFRMNPNNGFPNQLDVSFTLTPRIIEGRYLRKSTWTFSVLKDGPNAVTEDRIGAVALCCHLVTAPISHSNDGSVVRSPQLSALQHGLSNALEGGYQCFGQCYFCAVDFLITPGRENRTLMIEAWQDLGGENNGSPGDETYWRAAAWDRNEMPIAHHMRRTRLIKRAGGTVRRSYGESRYFMTKGLVRWKNLAIHNYMADSLFYHPLMV